MKLLLIRLSSIGDIVLTTPVVRCLKRQAGEVTLHYAVRRSFRPVIEANPYIDRIIALDRSVAEIIPLLRNERYDAVVDLQNNLRSARIRRALPARSSCVNKLNVRKWMLVNLKLNLMPSVHLVDRYMETVRRLGVSYDGRGLDYFLPAGSEAVTGELPPAFSGGYVAVAAGAGHATKCLPQQKLIGLCRKINGAIVLLGGDGEKERAGAVATELGGRVFNACGRYDINQSAALVKNARKVIAHDTGLMHIAAAMDKDIVSLWGNTVPAFGMSPFYASDSKAVSDIVEVTGLSCRPCTKIGFSQCPKSHFRCMNDMDTDRIAALVNG